LRRYRGITIVLVALIVALMVATCMAGELTGASTYGARWDAGEWIVSSGTTLDYEVVTDLYITLDLWTDYPLRSQPASRYELSVNYYPSFWVLRGWCISAGGIYRATSGPVYFLELSKPLQWPPGWLRTVWGWFRRE